MDQLIAFFTRKNIAALLVLAVLAAGLLVGLRLVQQQTQIKSKAASSCNTESTFCMWFDPDPATTGGSLKIFVVGREGDTNVRIDGSFSSSDAAIFAGSDCGQSSYQYCWRFSIPSSRVTAGAKTVRFLSEQAPSGRVTSSVEVIAAAQTSPSPSPVTSPSPAGSPVSVGGSLKYSDGRPIASKQVTVFISGTVPTQTKTYTTDGAGRFTSERLIPVSSEYAVRGPDIAGYTRAPFSHYEKQVAGSGDCSQSCDFTYTPVAADSSECSYNFKSLDTGTAPRFLVSGTKYQLNISMKNTGGSIWKETDRYQLKALDDSLTGEDTMTLWSIASPLPGLGNDINPGSSKTFPMEVRAPTTRAGEHRQVGFYFIMAKGEQTFSAACQPTNIDITPSSAGSPTFDFKVGRIRDMEITRGSFDTQTVEVTRQDQDSRSLVINLSSSVSPSGGVRRIFSDTSCTLRRAGSSDDSCTPELRIEVASDASTRDRKITVIARADDPTGGQLEEKAEFDLEIRSTTTTSPSPSASPSPSIPPIPAVKTECFFMDDEPITANSCSDEGAQAYTTHPMVVPLALTTPGRKTVFVRFISTDGQKRNVQRVINFAPDPRLTEVSCAHSLSGSGSVVSITGIALGSRGRGKVKLAGDDANIITWNETDGTITAAIDKRIEGKNQVEITRDDGKTARGECIVGTTSVTFTAQSQCRSSGNFTAENVSVKIFANALTTIETEKPDPIINEKIKVGKDGKPVGFVPKLEKDKKYSLIVKAPGTLSKRIDFETKGGIRNLDAVTLQTGDIAPVISADGKINAFDRAELIRQWSLVRDVQRSGDFNQDGRINSIDYACMRQNINQSDEEFSPPTLAASPSPVGVGTTGPVGVGTTSPPPAGGGPSGILPFRVSFDPDFALIALDGDMGTETFLTLDLTLTGGPGLKSVYVQFFEDGAWGPIPPQTASILLN